MSNREIIKQVLEEVMEDLMAVFDHGAEKYPDDGEVPNFLTENGIKCSHKMRHDSAFHHLAESYTKQKKDKDSGEDPRLHCIACMSISYIRDKRGIVHPLDRGDGDDDK